MCNVLLEDLAFFFLKMFIELNDFVVFLFFLDIFNGLKSLEGLTYRFLILFFNLRLFLTVYV